MTKYIIDSSCFIEASRVHNPLDVALSFWNEIKKLAEQGRIFSIDKVKDELIQGNDELSSWVTSSIPSSFFLDTTDTDVINAYAKLMRWSSSSTQYTPAAKAEFATSTIADAFLASYAATNADEYVVVTNEESNPDSKRRIKLPDACDYVNVRCVRIMQMLREMHETF